MPERRRGKARCGDRRILRYLREGGILSKKKKLRVIPIGGLGEIGMNMTLIEYGDDMIVIDCGMSFPADDMLGIDLVIPDITYLLEHVEKLRGVFITHGHEDHIGALPYLMRRVSVPLYATKLTMALIDKKFEEHGLTGLVEEHVVSYGTVVDAGCFSVEFIKTNHSIQDAAAFAIRTPVGMLVHTGDFKVDYTPVYGDPIDLHRFAELGSEGVLALMCDSTNATREGFTMSESTVGRTFDDIFASNTGRRIIVATFASNVDRVQQIVNTAYKFDRKVVVEGRSMVNTISTAVELGYVTVPEGTLIEIDDLKKYEDEKTVLITTGSQGESMAALSRMASGMHRKVRITANDTVVLSSTPIPGNEKAVYKVINELSEKGARVIFQDTHVSGHACSEEIKLIYSLVRPTYSIPVHGEHRHLVAQARIAEQLGIPEENTFIMRVGDVLEFGDNGAAVSEHVTAGSIFVDGLGVGDVGNVVLRDRHNLAENGIMVVAITVDSESREILSGPRIVSRGFIYVKESEEFIDETETMVIEAVHNLVEKKGKADVGALRNAIRDALRDLIWKRMRRNPVILPIIMEI
ncbi:MAG: ribonuclease J [Lachnospiraceae bacterium]|nr:ribonuclease J [Lachnospiraceae bacterium]